MGKKTGALRRVMALLLAVVMAVGGVPATALAEAIESNFMALGDEDSIVSTVVDVSSTSVADDASESEDSTTVESLDVNDGDIVTVSEGEPVSALVEGAEADVREMLLEAQTSGVDDYPADLKAYPRDAITDPWYFYNRECTSFVAWRLNNDNGVPFHNYYLGPQWGHAYNWDDAARMVGIPVDSNPAVGSIAQWDTGDFGHVAWVRSVSGDDVTIEEYNYLSEGLYNMRTLKRWQVGCYIHVKDMPTDREPVGMVSACQCVGHHLLRVCGWAYDPDAPNDSIRFHVYVGGGVGSGGRCYTTDAVGNELLANYQYRSQGQSEFDYTLYVEETGNQPIYIYAINHEEGGDSPELSGSGVVVNITSDTAPPVISNVRVTDVSASGYTVSCTVTDDYEVDRVQFPTWTAHVVDGTDQDDIASEWWTNPAVRGTRSGDTWTFRVNVSDHGYEQGTYRTHIYAYDASGNRAFSDTPSAECVYRYGPDTTVANGTYKLLSAADTNYALDVAGMSTEPEANVQVYERNESSAQCWKLTRNDDGTYTIASACSNLVLDSWCATYQSGASIVQYVDNGGDNQRWYIQECGDGTYALKCKHSNMFLDMWGLAQNGTNVAQGYGNGNTNQRWYLVPLDASAWEVTVANQTYTGKALKPAPTVKCGSTTLKSGTDYTVSYKNNVNVGTATVTVTGKGNYSGTKSATFKITARSMTPTIELSETELPYLYGAERRPAVTVKDGSAVLAEGTDYTLTWPKSSKELGTYTVAATLKGNRSGNASASYKIVPHEIVSALIYEETPREPGVSDKVYTGSAITPKPKVKCASCKNSVFLDPLSEGVDYTLAYEDNVNVGTATIVITFKNHYTGELRCNFNIVARSIAEATTSSIPAQTWTGKAVTPKPTVKFGGATLRLGTDYTLSYKNNTNVGTATVTVTGKGNYAGARSATFRVSAAPLSKATVSSIAKQAYTGKAVTPRPTVKLGSTTLKLNTDYTLKYANNMKAGTATVTVTGKGNYAGSRKVTFKIVAPSVSYFVHRQTYGWEDDWSKKDGDPSGTTGESKRLEGIKVRLGSKPYAGGISYQTHIQTYGWESSWRRDGAMSGTMGESKRLEAIRIKLTGEMAKHYDVYYRVHAQRLGWMGWAKNGANAGTAGYSYRLESIQIVVRPKGASAPGRTYKGVSRQYAEAFAQKS